MGVEGCTALVTGANRGIGLALVRALLDRGAAKVYAGARTRDSLDAVRADLGERLVPLPLDVTHAADRDAAAAQCTDVDLLVSNAGISYVGPALNIADENVRDLFDVNVFGPLALVRAFAPALREHRGGVILVHSLSSFVLSRSAPLYAASKAASMMMGYGLREQLGADGVTVTNVAPGFVETEMTTYMTSPKAPALSVAHRTLEGWEQGLALVFPDRYAEVVHEHMLADMGAILDDPVAAATAMVSAFATDPLAGT